MVLGGEDVAGGPGHFSTEGDQRLDEDGSLDSPIRENISSMVNRWHQLTYGKRQLTCAGILRYALPSKASRRRTDFLSSARSSLLEASSLTDLLPHVHEAGHLILNNVPQLQRRFSRGEITLILPQQFRSPCDRKRPEKCLYAVINAGSGSITRLYLTSNLENHLINERGAVWDVLGKEVGG